LFDCSFADQQRVGAPVPRPSAPVHPKAFDLVERQRKTGNLSNQFAGLLAAAGAETNEEPQKHG
jgi:hypothetical protein